MRQIGVIGHGAIGSVVASELAAGRAPGCELGGVLTRSRQAPMAVASIDDLLERCDVVVEAAGPAAVAEHGPTVLAAGLDLLVVSVGALVDECLRSELTGVSAHRGGGRLLLSAGAVGGLGLLRAASLMGVIDAAHLTTTKTPAALVSPWMSPSLIAELEHGTHPVAVFEGSAGEAVARFPSSVNVAATLALATLGFERTRVTIVGDRAAARVRHVIAVEGDAGRYAFHIENTPSANPRTSAITPFNVLRALSDTSDAVVVGL